MPFALELLNLSPHFPVTARYVRKTLRTPLGNGVHQVRDVYGRGTYEFTISEKDADDAALRELWGFFHYHGGDQPFAFYQAGHPLFDIPTDDPMTYGRGDGVRTEWFLPNRYIIGGTILTYHSSTRAGGGTLDVLQPSLDVIPGLVTHGVTPASGDFLQASYSCYYKVVLASDNDTLFTMQTLAEALHSFEGLVLREVP